MIPTLKAVQTLAAAYSEATGTPFKTVSSRIFDDGKKLDSVMAGKTDLTTARFDRAMIWFAENWPAGVKWPAGVPRRSVLLEWAKESAA